MRDVFNGVATKKVNDAYLLFVYISATLCIVFGDAINALVLPVYSIATPHMYAVSQ